MNKLGLLGKDIGYSYSKKIHDFFLKKLDLKATYQIIDLDEKDLEKQLVKLKSEEYLGYNVTIPYKEKILEFVQEKDELVAKLNACNTLLCKKNVIQAYNTDYYGFKYMIEESKIDFNAKNVYILGTGASSKTVELVLSELNCCYKFVSRTPINDQVSYEKINKDWVDIIINTTPVGSVNLNKRILDRTIVENKIVFDLTYNPPQSLLIKDAKLGFNGLSMLIVQAFNSLKLWYGFDYMITKKDIDDLKGELLK